MDLYRHYLAPRVVDFICSPQRLGKWRSRCVEDLAGVVVEVGFGAGRNLQYYPKAVTEIIAIEPSPIMRRRAAKRIDETSVPVRWGGLDGQHLDLDDDSVDAAVMTFALCTIPDPVQALVELRRVVRDGGQLRTLEHGLAPDTNIAKWQHRLNGLEQRLADGCQLIRESRPLVEQAGWHVTADFHRFTPGPKPWCYFTSLRAE
jgi:ubiquinone/menaquinone biosynthesis C-methylase UbiE